MKCHTLTHPAPASFYCVLMRKCVAGVQGNCHLTLCLMYLIQLLIGVIWQRFKVLIRGIVQECEHSQPALCAEPDQVQNEEVVVLLCHCDDKPVCTTLLDPVLDADHVESWVHGYTWPDVCTAISVPDTGS